MKLEDIESLMYLVRINCTDTITNADGTLDFGGLASHEIIAFTGSAFIFDNGMKFTAEELEAEAMRQHEEHFLALRNYVRK